MPVWRCLQYMTLFTGPCYSAYALLSLNPIRSRCLQSASRPGESWRAKLRKHYGVRSSRQNEDLPPFSILGGSLKRFPCHYLSAAPRDFKATDGISLNYAANRPAGRVCSSRLNLVEARLVHVSLAAHLDPMAMSVVISQRRRSITPRLSGK